jgi:hypothetical protein
VSHHEREKHLGERYFPSFDYLTILKLLFVHSFYFCCCFDSHSVELREARTIWKKLQQFEKKDLCDEIDVESQVGILRVMFYSLTELLML